MDKEKKSAWPWLILSIAIIILDQYTKHLVIKHFTFNQPYPILPFVNIALRYNPGAAFSFLGEASGWQLFLFAAVAIIISLVLLGWIIRTPRSNWLLATALSLILGGAVGNALDRIRIGYVVDFIDFHCRGWHYATFNVADSAICIGAGLLIIRVLFFNQKNNKR